MTRPCFPSIRDRSNRTPHQVRMLAFVIGAASWVLVASACVASAQSTSMPSTALLSDVEISLVTGGHGGCVGRCVDYHITVRGDGVVELEDVGTPPRAATQRRSITSDEVVSLVNEFLRARFFDAMNRYDTITFVVRQDDKVLLRSSGGIDGGAIYLTMRLGTLKKTVHLSNNVPVELRALANSVLRIGGRPELPQTWPSK
jgi:hypothetical protein